MVGEPDKSSLTRKDLFQMCLDLLKKIQNLNCADEFFQDTSTLGTNDGDLRNKQKLQFEASTMNICPMDFSRVLVHVTQESKQEFKVGFSILLPNTKFKIRAIPQMKMVSTPLSRLLLGKVTSEAESLENAQDLMSMRPASGFVTLDSEKRIFPLLPQDPFLQETPVVGIWLWGVEDLRSPYVWAACTRFLFCRNFKPQQGKMPSNQANQFLIVNFKKNP